MPAEHNTITDPELHEPKGVAAASANAVYLADGLGSGAWEHAAPHAGFYYSDIGTGTTLTTPTAYTLVGPATTATHVDDFTHNSLGRVTFTGASDRHVHMVCDIVFKHSTGGGQDCFFTIFKNGIEQTGADIVQSADSTDYQKIAMHWDDQASTNDYYEIYSKASTGSIIVHKYYVFVMGMPA